MINQVNPPASSIRPPEAGAWVEQWLSRPRLDVYLRACGDDLPKALDLYEWNSTISCSFMRDLAHCEVALRNAYDEAVTSRWHGSTHWLCDPRLRLFKPLWRSRGAKRIDVNEKPRRDVQEAARRCGGPAAPPGKVIAELSFGFWRYLTSSAHEKSIWVPYVHAAFPRGTNRRDIDRKIAGLNRLRNRAAHHEPIFSQPLEILERDLIYVCGLLSPQVAQYIQATSSVYRLLRRRP